MIYVAELVKVTEHTDQELVDRHRHILESIGLPTTYQAGRSTKLYDAMIRDEKNRDGTIRFVILEDPDETTRPEGPGTDDLEHAYELLYNNGQAASEESARSWPLFAQQLMPRR